MDATSFIEKYYAGYDEEARLGSRSGSVEYLTTMRYLNKYLREGMRVLEVGAGTGRYSLSIARMGYQVDAVELVQSNIDVFRSSIREGDTVTVTQGNAMDLSFIADGTYDIVLLLGPMYHLFTTDDRLRAMSEALRVLKKGGLLFTAYCNNDSTMLQFCFGKGMIMEEHYRNLIDFTTFRASSNPEDLFVLCRREDIDRLMEHFDVTRLHYIGTDMATKYMSATVDAMSDELFDLYLRYHFVICERTDMTGISHHLLDVVRKN